MKISTVIKRTAFAAATVVFVFSSYKVATTLYERSRGEKLIDTMKYDAVKINFEPSHDKVATDDSLPENTQPVAAEKSPISVDFDILHEQSEDIVAWLYCPDTVINYPVMQSDDNKLYLSHLPDGSRNSAGSLFVDYRNADDFSDANTVIYGHSMSDGRMFGTLESYASQAFYEAHQTMYLSTPERNFKIEIAAGFAVRADDELYSVDGDTTAEEILKRAVEKSDFSATLAETPNEMYDNTSDEMQDDTHAETYLVTLSTCSARFSDARFVLVGVLCEI